MNIQIISKEIKSSALNEIVKSLVETVERVKSHKIDQHQANVEIVGCKHIIQSIALDWAFNGKIKKLPAIVHEK